MLFLIRCVFFWVLLPALLAAGIPACNHQSATEAGDDLVAVEPENSHSKNYKTEIPPGAASPAEAAQHFINAMIACDPEGMRAIILSHTELAALSRKTIAREKYEQKVREFIAGRQREACERKPGLKLHSLEATDKRLLRAADSSKLKRDLETIHIMPVFSYDREISAGRSLLFVKSDSGWKLSISH